MEKALRSRSGHRSTASGASIVWTLYRARGRLTLVVDTGDGKIVRHPSGFGAVSLFLAQFCARY